MRVFRWLKEKKTMSWVTQAFAAMVSVSVMMLVIKRLTQFGLPPEIVNLFFFLFTTIAIGVFVLVKKTRLELPIAALPWFILVAVIAVAYNYFSVSAIGLAPNPGYVNAIDSFRVAVITIASIVLFDSEITVRKGVGIGLAVCGLILVSL